jgi:hypothetical protein
MILGIVGGIILIVLGALCIPTLVAEKNPKAKELLDKIVPVQGIFGFILFIWGIWEVISTILSLGLLGQFFPWGLLYWLTSLVIALLCLGGGAILGWSMIQKNLLAKVPDNVKEKAEASYQKILVFQPKIGIIAIIFGAWTIIWSIVFYSLFIVS